MRAMSFSTTVAAGLESFLFQSVPTVMFGSLFGKKKQGSYPVATEDGIDAILKGMPRDDMHFLGAVDDWLEDIAKLIDQIGLNACLRAALRFDTASRPTVSGLLRDYLTPGSERHLSKLINDKLAIHAERLRAAYSLVAFSNSAMSAQNGNNGDGKLSLDVLKAVGQEYFRVLGLDFRLAKFRYRKPGPESWHQAHAMLRFFQKQPGQASGASTHEDLRDEVFREYLRVVCLALVPMNNLSPQQLEFVARMLANAKNIECLAEPTTDTTHLIDISTDVGPIPYKPDFWAADGAILYYLSVTSLQGLVRQFQESLEQNAPLPREFATLPIARNQVTAVLSALTAHWTNQPPNRSSDRIVAIEAMRGAVGFGPALNLVEITEKARTEGLIEDPQSDLLNRLWRLEDKVDKHKLEEWTQVDGNHEGVGVTIPTILSQHVAGSLVSMRYADEPGWHLGVVRRVGIDASGVSRLGLKTFSGSPKVVELKLSEPPSHISDTGAAIRGIAFDSNDNQLLIPTGTYVEGLKIGFSLNSIQRNVSLIRLVESGPDFELVEFTDE